MTELHMDQSGLCFTGWAIKGYIILINILRDPMIKLRFDKFVHNKAMLCEVKKRLTTR
jgi:hypothetical protein